MKQEATYADLIEQALLKADVLFSKIETGGRTNFPIILYSNDQTELYTNVIVDDVGDIQIQFHIAQNIPERSRADVIMECNRLNYENRYLCLCTDMDGDVLATYDFSLFGEDENSIKARFITTLVLCWRIAEKFVPEILAVI